MLYSSRPLYQHLRGPPNKGTTWRSEIKAVGLTPPRAFQDAVETVASALELAQQGLASFLCRPVDVPPLCGTALEDLAVGCGVCGPSGHVYTQIMPL